MQKQQPGRSESGQEPHQSVGHGLLVLVQVHEVIVVSCGGKDPEFGGHSEQEAPGVTCTQTHNSLVPHINTKKQNPNCSVAEACEGSGCFYFEMFSNFCSLWILFSRKLILLRCVWGKITDKETINTAECIQIIKQFGFFLRKKGDNVSP